MESRKSVQGHFKYLHFEVTWTREDLPSGQSVDTVTRTYGPHPDYSDVFTFEDPDAAAEKFLNWTMSLSCMTDEQAATLFTSLMKEKDLEQAALWNKAVVAAQGAQSASRKYLDMKHDPERSPAERGVAYQAYGEAQRRLLAVLVELKIVRRR